MSAVSERGLPIMRQTQCKVGTHVYVVIGGNAKEPAFDQQCDCGLERWAGLHSPLASIPAEDQS